MQAAFSLLAAHPAPGAFIIGIQWLNRARPAPNRGVALGHKRVAWQIVVFQIVLHLLARPGQNRRHLHTFSGFFAQSLRPKRTLGRGSIEAGMALDGEHPEVAARLGLSAPDAREV